MTTRIAINGFGRIGRQVMRIATENYSNEIEVVAFNDLGDVPTMAHLLRYDSNYGKFPGTVEVEGSDLIINGKTVKGLCERNPADLPWGELNVDIVIESTGFFRTQEACQAHLDAGAKKVIISAPAKGEVDKTVVLGVNDADYDPAVHNIVSNASCTTNCLAPAAKVINDAFGINKGVITTIHAYTGDQPVLDTPHSDLRRARNAATNMVPTSTGAAKAVALVIPELAGKFNGMAVRVPTSTVSLVDGVFELEKDATTEEVRAALKAAATEGPLKGILGYSEEPLVSVDFKGDSRSSIVDAEFTEVYGGNMLKLLTWYDNEWGYSVRTVELAVKMGKSL
ncbi:type I glyceraldehyde-3-phosphate dehydrogenase [Chloroflexota bacterium]